MINLSNILQNNGTGIIFNVKLIPNSSFSKITDYTEDYIKIKISSPAVENRANKELIEFCSNIFDINKSKISIISGEKSKIKKILMKDTNLDIVSKKLLFVLNSIKKE